jgi:large subunit ribosomal protein L25
MDVITIEARPREAGKKAARSARREGWVPCVLYGHHVEPVAFQVPELTLKPLIYTAETHRVSLKVDGSQWDCILKDLDFDPVTDKPIHADFQALQAGEKITLTVPVHFTGTAVGQIQQGGDVNFVVHELQIRCLPQDIPASIDVDITNLSIGDSIHIRDISVANVEFIDTEDKTLVTVLAPRVEAAEPVEEAISGEEGATAAEEGGAAEA